MRNEITCEAYTKFIYEDLCELFEVMIQQQYFLDVINTNSGIVSRLYEYDSDAGMYNASYLYKQEIDDKDYLMRLRAKSVHYFHYDTLSDALAHANELLKVCDESI